MSLQVVTDQFAQLSTFEKLAIAYFGLAAEVDGTVAKAYQQMQSVKIPTHFIDIFDRTRMAWSKALFSPHYKEDPTPGFGFSAVMRKYERTLECYYVDKHLSSGISNQFMQEVIQRIERAAGNRLNSSEKDLPSAHSKLFFCTDAIQSLPDRGYSFVENFREINIEVGFMLRVVHRLRIQEESKLYSEIPLPKLSKPKYLNNLLAEMNAIDEGGLISLAFLGTKLSEPDKAVFASYLHTLFDERDRRMLKILKEAWQKDLKARETNSQAPLNHLVTLEGYEKRISQQRKALYTKIASVVVVIFFCWGFRCMV